MRELGIAASITCLMYCFQTVCGDGDVIMFWFLLGYYCVAMLAFMFVLWVVAWGGIKMFSAKNMWTSFCLSFLGVPIATIVMALALSLFI